MSAGLVVFLVALPLCLGVALASNAPLFSGIMANIVGGLVVGAISGSQTSVSGPATGLTAVVAAQIAATGSFDAFLVAVVLAGVLPIALGAIRAGAIADFVPPSVNIRKVAPNQRILPSPPLKTNHGCAYHPTVRRCW